MSQTLFSAFSIVKLLVLAEHLQPITYKTLSPPAGQSPSFSILSSQSGLFTFLKNDLNKAPELGQLPGKPDTEAQIFKKIRVRNKNKRLPSIGQDLKIKRFLPEANHESIPLSQPYALLLSPWAPALLRGQTGGEGRGRGRKEGQWSLPLSGSHTDRLALNSFQGILKGSKRLLSPVLRL